jgi:CRISPR associated protein Cas1
LAINPPNAILNYCFALAESECRLALSCCGLDPGIGFVHLDTANRDSLALDLLETIRPSIESWLLHWITRESLRRSDFFETGSGNCRLRSGICSQLSETAPTWGGLVAPWAEYVAHTLWARQADSKSPATPLTQRNKRGAKEFTSSRVSTVVVRPPHLCNVSGKRIQREHDYCQECAAKNSTACLISGARLGRIHDPSFSTSSATRPLIRNDGRKGRWGNSPKESRMDHLVQILRARTTRTPGFELSVYRTLVWASS